MVTFILNMACPRKEPNRYSQRPMGYWYNDTQRLIEQWGRMEY